MNEIPIMDITVNPKLKPFAKEKARYKIAYGGRASGKSWGVARLLLLKTRDETLRILCTREIQNSIKESVYRLLKDQLELMGISEEFDITNDLIRNKATGSEFIFKGLYSNIEKIKSLEGVDICWVEEAETMSEASWAILDPTIRKEGSEIWVTFNPRFEEDTVYYRFILNAPPPNSIIVKINYTDNKHVSQEILDQVEHLKQMEYDNYRHVWLGECKKIGDTRLFSMQEIEDSMAMVDTDDSGEVIWGLDVARFGDDRSVLAIRHGNHIKTIQKWQGLRTTELSDIIHTLYNQAHSKPDAIFVDVIGVGGGVVDQLSTRGLPVISANASASPTDDQYINKRAEMYYNFKKVLRYTRLPKDRDLLKELLLIEYMYNNAGKTQLVSKDIIKKNYGKSPDLADAVALTYFDIIYKVAADTDDWRGGY